VIVSGAASLIGAAAFGAAPPQVVAAVNAVAAGALLTMVVNTMIPEAVEGEQKLTGFLVVLGLLVAFSLSNLG
jgi:ZIP family zinc transporter